MIRLALLFVFFALGIHLSAEEAPVYNYTNWKVVKNEKLRFSVKLPKEWQFLEQAEPAIQVYFVTDKADVGEKDVSAKKLVVESKPVGEDYKRIADDMVRAVKNGEGGKGFIKEKDSKFGEIPTKEYTYHFREDGFEKTADVVLFKYKNVYYSFTFITASQMAMHDKALREQIIASINLDMMQPSAAFEIKKPKDWFDFKDNEYSQAFSKIDKGDKSPSDGIIKVKMVKIDEEKSLQQFTVEFSAQVTKEGAKTSGFALTSPVNGNKLMWFDVLDKDDMFKERYHVAKDGYTFYIIYFISSKEKFDKELKMELAESLLTFKLLPPK